MTLEEYETLSWPAKVKCARMALPKSTKQCLADYLCTTIHSVINWESGRSIPQKHYRAQLADLCLKGISPVGTGVGIDFLLGGFDANEKILTRPLLTRDKSSTTVALNAIAVYIASYIYAAINKKILVTTIDTVFNTYPTIVSITITPADHPEVKYIIRLSHLMSGTMYTAELLGAQNDTITNRFVCNVSDTGISTIVRLLKKSIKLLK